MNDGVVPSNPIPVSMVVQPAAPVLEALPPYVIGTSNRVEWLPVVGAARYWAEFARNTNGAAEGSSGWVTSQQHVFTGLEEGTLFYYRAIASATGAQGAVTGPWSDWGFSRQLPAAGDWDEDGLNNQLEDQLGLDPGKSDTDGDGYGDRSEYVAGTSGTDENDLLALTPLPEGPVPGRMVFSWQSVSGRVYSVLYTTNLPDLWPSGPLAVVDGDGTEKSFTNDGALDPKGYYRLQVEWEE